VGRRAIADPPVAFYGCASLGQSALGRAGNSYHPVALPLQLGSADLPERTRLRSRRLLDAFCRRVNAWLSRVGRSFEPEEKSILAPPQLRWRLRNSRILRLASAAASSLYSSQ